MRYFLIRDNEADTAIGILSFSHGVISPQSEPISKAEFDTYREFGIPTLEIDDLVKMLNLRLITKNGKGWIAQREDYPGLIDRC